MFSILQRNLQMIEDKITNSKAKLPYFSHFETNCLSIIIFCEHHVIVYILSMHLTIIRQCIIGNSAL